MSTTRPWPVGFQTCDYFLYGLAPGAKYLEATHPYLDGFGNAYASILDATTGKEIIKFDPADGAIVGTTWQDSEHLLARVYAYESKAWSIFRIGADKTVVEILGPDTKGNESNPAYTVLRLARLSRARRWPAPTRSAPAARSPAPAG